MNEKWKAFTEYVSYLWAKVEVKRLERKSQKKWSPSDHTERLYAWSIPLHLSPSQAKRWDSLKRYEYSYRTRNQIDTN